MVKKKLLNIPDVKESLIPATPEATLEVDEVWSFVFEKANQSWLWTVMCRQTRQIIAFVNGDHSTESCQTLWDRIPPDYQTCHNFSDFWKAYAAVFPVETHRLVGKETGETAHMER